MSANSPETPGPTATSGGPEGSYEPPALSRLGDLTEVTLVGGKTVGAADGATFLGLDIGSV